MNRVLCENARLYFNYYVFEAFRASDYFKTSKSLYLNFRIDKAAKSYDETQFYFFMDNLHLYNKANLYIQLNHLEAELLI